MLPELCYMLAHGTGPIHEGKLYSQAAWHAEANARDAESKDESGDEEDDPGAGQAAPHAGGGSPAGAGEAAPPLLSATGISRRMKPSFTGVKPANNFAGAGSRKGIRSVTTRWIAVTS